MKTGTDAFTYSSLHKAVASESRICFGIAWFATEEAANSYSEYIKSKGHTYNGGMFHGMACGRDKSFDRDGPAGNRWYAVTH